MTEVRRRLVEEAEADERRDDEGFMVLGDVAETVSSSSPEVAATVLFAPDSASGLTICSSAHVPNVHDHEPLNSTYTLLYTIT